MGGRGDVHGGVGARYFESDFPPPREGKKSHRHHWYPQQLWDKIKGRFPDADREILSETDRLEDDFHHYVHGKDGTLADSYNDEVDQWLKTHTSPSTTLDDLLWFVGERREYYRQLYDVYLLHTD